MNLRVSHQLIFRQDTSFISCKVMIKAPLLLVRSLRETVYEDSYHFPYTPHKQSAREWKETSVTSGRRGQRIELLF